MFKIIVKSLSYQYSETKKQKKYNKPKNNESKYRDIDLEAKIVDVEKIEDDLFVKNDEEKVIVGINKGRVLGKFTAMFAKRFMSDIMKLDINQIRNKGYFQAKILSERNSYEKFKRGR